MVRKPLMYYRVHESNDSILENIPDRIRLMNYMKKIILIKNQQNFYYIDYFFGLDGSNLRREVGII